MIAIETHVTRKTKTDKNLNGTKQIIDTKSQNARTNGKNQNKKKQSIRDRME